MAFNRAKFANLYPFKSNYLLIDGHRYHYLDEGTGAPIVMLHGNPTWSFYFRELVAKLRQSSRVIVPDHMGCGLSDKPSDSEYKYTLEERVRNLESLLESLNLKQPITLVLHDWGGMIGFSWATRNPERIAKLVVLNTAAFRLPSSKKLPWTLNFVRNAKPFGAIAVRGFNAFAGLATRMAVRQKLPANIAEGLTAPYDSWKNRIATLKFVEDIPLSESDESYARVCETESKLELLKDKPMLIAWGRHDFVFDDHFLREWQRRFPKAKVKVFEDAGHYVLEDASHEIVPLISSFVT